MNERLQKLFDALKGEYDLGTFKEFEAYLADDKKRKLFYEEIIAPNFEVESLDIFEQAYGLKKKDDTEVIGEETVMESPGVMDPDAGSSGVSVPTVPQNNPQDQYDVDGGTYDTVEVNDERTRFAAGRDAIATSRDSIANAREGNSRDNITADKAEDDTMLEELVGKNFLTDFIGDIYRAGKQGYVQGNTADESYDLMFKGSDASPQDIAEFIKSQEELQALGETDEMRSFNQIYEEAGGGVLGFLKGLAYNPSVATQLAAQTITQMVNPASAAAAGTVVAGGAGVGALAGGVGALPGAIAALPTAFGAAGMALETGMSFAEFLREEVEKNGDNFDEAGIQKVLADEDAMFNIRAKSAGRGAVIGLVDRYTMKMGGKIIGKQVAKGVGKGKRFATATAVEGIGGGVGEAGARLVVGQDMDAREIGFETIGGTGKAPFTYAYGKLKSKPVYKINGGEVDLQTYTDMVNKASDKDFAAMKFEVENDSEVKDFTKKRKKKLRIRNKLVQDLNNNPDIKMPNEETLDELVELQSQKEEIGTPRTPISKKKLERINKRIEGILDGTIDVEVNRTDDGKGNTTEEVVEVSEEYTIEQLKEEGIDNPTQEQIDAKQAELMQEGRDEINRLKQEDNAIQESSTESVDASEQAEVSSEVGDGNTETTTTEESITETENDPTETTQEEVTQESSDLETLIDGEPTGNVVTDETTTEETEVDTTPENETTVDETTTEEQTTNNLEETQQVMMGEESVNQNEDGSIDVVNNRSKEKVKLKGEKQDDNVYIVEESESMNSMDPKYDGSEVQQKVQELKIVSLAKMAAKAAKKILPGVNFVLHRTEESYNRATGQTSRVSQGKKGSRGLYAPGTNDIHINMANANGKTIAHEVFHAVVFNKYGSDLKIADVTKRMVAALDKKITDPALKEKLKEFSNQYTQYQNEEYLSELIGILADNYKVLNTPEKSLVKKWIAKVSQMVGLSKEVANKLVVQEDDILEVLQSMAENIKEGKQIDEVNLDAFEVSDMGKPVDNAEGNIPNNIEDNGPPINLDATERKSMVDRGGINTNEIERGSINDLSGTNAFVFAADQATYGKTKSPSGLEFMFNGGFLYPYGAQSQGSNAAWVFSNETAANKVLNKAKESDGVGLVMSQASDGITGNLQFYDFLNAEVAHAIKKGASPKEMVAYINEKLKLTKVANGLKKKGLPAQIKSVQELQDLLKTLNFEQRGSFAKTFMSKESYDKFGIYPFSPLKTINADVESAVNDPSIADVSYGDIVSAIQFDKEGKPFKLKEGDPGYHPAYPWAIPGNPIMVFNKAVDVRKVFPNAKPVAGNQTPLGKRKKPLAARSAMGGQYVDTVPSNIDVTGEEISQKDLELLYPETNERQQRSFEFTQDEVDKALDSDKRSVEVIAKGLQPKQGEKVGIRLNLNVLKNKGIPIQTVHKGQVSDKYKRVDGKSGFFGGEAINYAPAVTLKDAHLNTSQLGIYKIKEGITNKTPIASVDGLYQEVPLADTNFDGVEIRFNPMTGNLFETMDGKPVRSVEEATVVGFRVFGRGKIEYFTEANKPKPYTPNEREQKAELNPKQKVTKLAQQNGMNQSGFFSNQLWNPAALRKQLEKQGYGLKAAYRSYGDGGLTGYYITKNGRKYNPPLNERLQQVEFSSEDTNKDIVEKARQMDFSDAAISDYLKRVRKVKADDIEVLLARDGFLIDSIPRAFGNVEGGMNVGKRIYEAVTLQLAKFKKKKPTNGELRQKAFDLLTNNEDFKKQPKIVQDELVSAFDRTLATTANRKIQKTINDIRKGLLKFKQGVKAAQQGKARLRQFIRTALPKGEYSKSVIDRVSNLIEKSSAATYLADAKIVLDIVEAQREKQKKAIIKKIKAIVDKKAGKTLTKSGKERSKGLDAEGQQFFATVKKILDLALDTKRPEALQSLIDELNKPEITIGGKVISVKDVLAKEMRGEKLTLKETKVLEMITALDTFGDIQNMSLEDVTELLAGVKDVRAESIKRLAANRLKRAIAQAQLDEQATNEIKENYPFLFNEDGTLKDENDLDQDARSTWNKFQELKIWDGIKSWANRYQFTSGIGIADFFRKKIAHLGTLMNLMDNVAKGNKFFIDNVYNRINRMETKALEGKQRMLDSMTEGLGGIANSIEGVTKGYKELLTLLPKGTRKLYIKGKEVTITIDEMMRLYALSKNDIQSAKLEKMGYDADVMSEVERTIGPIAVEFVDKVVDFLSNQYFEETNQTYKQVNDVNLNYVANYFPTSTLSENVDSMIMEDGGANFNGIFNAEYDSAFKKRVDREGTLKTGLGFTNVLSAHIDSMERYKAFAEGTKILNNIFSNKAVDTLMQELGVKQVVKNIINVSVNPNSGLKQQASKLAGIMSKFTQYALSFKIIQIPKQATSFVNAYEDYVFSKGGKRTPGLDMIMFMADIAKVIATFPKQVKKAYAMSPDFRNRLAQGLEGDVYGLEAGSRTYKPMSPRASKVQRTIQLLKTAAASPTIIGDVMGVMGYMANYNRNIANGMSKADALQAFNNYNATQQSRRSSDKNMLQLSGDELTRSFTMFGSTLFLQMNKVMSSTTNIMRALKEGKKSDKNQLQKDVRSFTLNLAVANVLFVAVANMMKFSGDDEDEEEAMSRIKDAAMGLNLLYQVPLIGGASEVAIAKARGERGFGDDVMNPYKSIMRKVIKGMKEDNGFKSAQPLLEIAMGAQLDPFIGLFNVLGADIGDTTDDEAVMMMFGISPSYRPSDDGGDGGTSRSTGSRGTGSRGSARSTNSRQKSR